MQWPSFPTTTSHPTWLRVHAHRRVRMYVRTIPPSASESSSHKRCNMWSRWEGMLVSPAGTSSLVLLLPTDRRTDRQTDRKTATVLHCTHFCLLTAHAVAQPPPPPLLSSARPQRHSARTHLTPWLPGATPRQPPNLIGPRTVG